MKLRVMIEMEAVVSEELFDIVKRALTHSHDKVHWVLRSPSSIELPL